MKPKVPTVHGAALFLLRKDRGWSNLELAGKSGIARSTLTAYQNGELALDEEVFEKLARAVEAGPDEIARFVFAAALTLPPLPLVWTPVDPTQGELRVIDRAAVAVARDAFDLVREHLVGDFRQQKAQLARDKGRELARELLKHPEAARRDEVSWGADFQHWAVAVTLCEHSEAAAAHDPRIALRLAELALHVARHVEDVDGFGPRIQGYCTAAVGNCQRVLNRVPDAGATFATALRLWHEGKDEAGLLSQARMFDLEASLRRDQGLPDLALQLHDKALKVARPEEVGHLLLNKSATLDRMGDSEASIEVLAEAARVVDGERQPRLRFGLLFNRVAGLIRLDRAAEAALIVPEVRDLAERLRNDLDLLKTLWLEANVAASLGQRAAALGALEQVRRDLRTRTLPYDYALASLDIALLYRKESRFGEIMTLANEMLAIFRAQGVHREAIAAILLFRDAAERESVTLEMVRRLQNYLTQARSNPDLQFAG
jgi:transcriptional regulator with XRE-family HTH domain